MEARNNIRGGYWCVFRTESRYEYDSELKMNVWREYSHEEVTPRRESQEEADKDFAELGFKLCPNAICQCNDDIKPEKYWVRHIVQHKTIITNI